MQGTDQALHVAYVSLNTGPRRASYPLPVFCGRREADPSGICREEVEMKLWERVSHKKRASHKKGVTKPMAHPTPIRISKRTAIVVALALLATLVLVLWAVPSVLISVVGGFGLALVLSFPVRILSHLMPRGVAILMSFLALFGLILLAILILVPLLILQGVSLVRALPDLANNAQRYLL